jgi:hypothetical protein
MLAPFSSPPQVRPPQSPALRRLAQIDLSFFSPSGVSSPRHRGQVSPAFFDYDSGSHTNIGVGIAGKSSRKHRKPRLTKRTRQVLSFLDDNDEKENITVQESPKQQPAAELPSPAPSYNDLVPMHRMVGLHRRSEVMEHNINVGLELHYYLLSQGLTPTRATKMARPYFMEEWQPRTPPKSFTPFRKSARVLFGHDSVLPTPSPRRVLESVRR